MLIILCFALAWAVQGAVSQTWTDGRAAASSAGQAVKTRTAKARKSKSRGVRYAANTGTVLAVCGAGTWRAGRGIGRSLVTGARDGWVKGRSRGIARREDKRARRGGGRDDPAAPTWGHYITGRCPWCDHLPKASAAETDGCGCENLDWGCQCAMRNRSRERHPEPAPDEPPPLPPHDWEERLRELGFGPLHPPINFRDKPDSVPDDEPINGGPMPITGQSISGEAANIEAARDDLDAFAELAAQHLDIATAAQDQAKGMEAAAENMLAGMIAGDLDPETLAEVRALQEQARELREAAARLQSAAEAVHVQAGSTRTGMDERHGLFEEAVNASAHAPNKEWVQHR